MLRTTSIDNITTVPQKITAVDINSITTVQNISKVTIGAMLDDRELAAIPAQERGNYYIKAGDEKTFSGVVGNIYLRSMASTGAKAVMIKS
jgi:hypothetical protein